MLTSLMLVSLLLPSWAAYPAQSEQQTPSLADLARSQPPRNPAAKVYTNDDFAPAQSPAEESPSESGPGAVPSDQAEAEEGSTEQQAAAGEPLPPEQDPAYWRERVEPLQQELARLDQEIRRVRGMTGALSPAQTGMGLDLAGPASSLDPQQSLANLESQKRALESQLAAIADEARRAGVPPAWVR